MAAVSAPNNKVLCVIGTPLERGEGEESGKYVYIQGHVALYSPKPYIPAEPFMRMVRHYLVHNDTPRDIATLQQQNRITQIVRFRDISEIFPEQRGEE